MDLREAIKLRIKELANERKITVSKLSTLAGISPATLSKCLSGHRQYLRIDMIEFICEALDIKLKDFFDSELFNNIEIKE